MLVGCSGGTSLVLHVPRSSPTGKRQISIIVVIISIVIIVIITITIIIIIIIIIILVIVVIITIVMMIINAVTVELLVTVRKAQMAATEASAADGWCTLFLYV